MSNKLFAFNVSKQTEKVDEKSKQQWTGQTAAVAGYCTSQNYGNATCYTYWIGNYYERCVTGGGSGYYICDGN